ncbi:cap-specific mRNA (nucleoside-2'-O-)-methyltransferase 1-like isoform X2 [Cylas formicarius]|uniref:cap-specific mRNA (nucleoside-2'-O-)-methyltransferase 1-like isoform X2 n=1 Tax=Cylas formicarius TaxID=197179 RepID=UPI0029589684|nr:cap-specific mRNA (nucleoside-2'-O-)-methyltransferase 1-like isoform X2 [Cylas formicarius]
MATLTSWKEGTTSKNESSNALRIMQKMGYIYGSGLGKNKQGITQAIDLIPNLGRRGFGHVINDLDFSEETWDFSEDDVEVQENLLWLESENKSLHENTLNSWLKDGKSNHSIDSTFCNAQILADVFEAKTIFDQLDLLELSRARAKSNPFETIKSVFFMNRAALKMANIDAATNFMFTRIEKSIDFQDEKGPIYFADICAGPGGFTEYVLWRKNWLYKGFGLTLKCDNDFRIRESNCASSATFQALYGKSGDGDVCNPENITDFAERVREESGGGVHFIMADGGFSVDGNEAMQEILSRNIYICQCMVALKVLKPNGHFVTKLFDVFTLFSVGLLYLIHLCFEKVTILKPKSSRPANSERYLICKRFRESSCTSCVREYLWKIVNRLWEMRDDKNYNVLQLVPLKVLQRDSIFFKYIMTSNNEIALNQIRALKKLACFCRNPRLMDDRQSELRSQCLEYWKIPDNPKKPQPKFTIRKFFSKHDIPFGFLMKTPTCTFQEELLVAVVQNVNDWYYCLTGSQNSTTFFLGDNRSNVYKFVDRNWKYIPNILLTPGTLIYGDQVTEQVEMHDKQTEKLSLHVIDALFLGNDKLQESGFHERHELIDIYCKSVNKGSQAGKSVKILHKEFRELKYLPSDNRLSVLGYGNLSEGYHIKSIMLINAKQKFSLESVYLIEISDEDSTFKYLRAKMAR